MAAEEEEEFVAVFFIAVDFANLSRGVGGMDDSC